MFFQPKDKALSDQNCQDEDLYREMMLKLHLLDGFYFAFQGRFELIAKHLLLLG
jgi:hypothetical protein